MEQNNEKNMTNYDRKVLAREEAAKHEKKKSVLYAVAAVAIVACIAALLIFAPMLKKKANSEFFKINNEAVSVAEFNFHYTSLVNNNATLLSYLGISDVAGLQSTVYDSESGATWADFFADRAAQTLKENRALLADAKEKGIELNIDKEYTDYMDQIKAAAETSEMDVDTYLASLYGATEKQLKNVIKDYLAATLYTEKLTETHAASDEEAQAEYDANKKEYDSVNYRVLEFAADITEESTEEEIATAMETAKKKAQEMLTKVQAGEDFETLCITYAPEERRDKYADSETDLSLVEDASSTYPYEPFNDWLFETDRKEGDSTLYTDDNTNAHYVVLFEKRYMGDTVMDSIKDTLTYDAVTKYIETISADYTISDPKGNLPVM